MHKVNGTWKSMGSLESRRFVCGHCGSDISSHVGYHSADLNNIKSAQLYVCHHCNLPTLFYADKQLPGPRMGSDMKHLPEDVRDMYDETRDTMSVGAYTSSVMAARKLLMHIAVQCGAEPGKKFVEYVNYLEKSHHTPPNSSEWVDRIRKLGNEANHEIVIMGIEEAKSLIVFLEMMLKFIYEFPNSIANTVNDGDD